MSRLMGGGTGKEMGRTLVWGGVVMGQDVGLGCGGVRVVRMGQDVTPGLK